MSVVSRLVPKAPRYPLNQSDSKSNQLRLGHTRFPALYVVCLFFYFLPLSSLPYDISLILKPTEITSSRCNDTQSKCALTEHKSTLIEPRLSS